MRVLHTSDWHLGRTLFSQSRYHEHAAFLDWLLETLERESIDLLLVAGDIFDTTTPSHRAQELYYAFLARAASTCCRHVVVIAGNHDSPTLLNAPAALLKGLNVHVVAAMQDDPRDEVIILKGESRELEALICAVPYLRERDLRRSEAFESIEERDLKMVTGVKEHYHRVIESAKVIRDDLQSESHIPLIVMGHLFMTGGVVEEGDGVRELYIGHLGEISATIFPGDIDYLALGHLHRMQRIGAKEHFRYSGAPLPMGFSEAGQQKMILMVAIDSQGEIAIESVNIPTLQRLKQISGDLDEILVSLEDLKREQGSTWVEVIYQGDSQVTDLRQRIDAMVAESSIRVLRIENRRIIERVMSVDSEGEPLSLKELTPQQVFERALEAHSINEEEIGPLNECYAEILRDLAEQDLHAE